MNGIIYFIDGELIVLTSEKEFHYKRIKDFIKEKKTFTDLFIESKLLEPLFETLRDYVKKNSEISFCKFTGEPKYFLLKGGSPRILSQKFFLGSDKLSPQQALMILPKDKINARDDGFTSTIRRALKGKIPEGNYHINKICNEDVSYTPLTFSINYREFQNVYRYDITATYPSLYCEELPMRPKYMKVKDFKLDSHHAHLVQYYVKGCYAKKINYMPLGLPRRYNKEKHQGIDNRGMKVRQSNMECPIRYWGWLEFDIPLFKDNYFGEIEMCEDGYEFELETCPELQQYFYDRVDQEKKMKSQGIDVAGFKQQRNRVHGFLSIERRQHGCVDDWEHLPTQFACYIVAKLRYRLDNLARRYLYRGQLVSVHTDSLYVLKDIKKELDIIWNCSKTHPYNMGRFHEEPKALRITRYSLTKAKILTEEGKELKHGGIADDCADEFLATHDYDEISENSVIHMPVEWAINEDDTGIYVDVMDYWTITLGKLVELTATQEIDYGD